MIRKYFLPLYFSIIIALTLVLAMHPFYNWDMLPYMAILEKMDGATSFKTIHQDIYIKAKSNVPERKYNKLFRNDYRKKMAADTRAFESQLPYYNIKPVYLGIAYVFYKMGFSLTYATVLPSLISFFLINVVLFFWIRRFALPFNDKLIILLFICCIAAPLATRSNPDELSLLTILISSYFFLEKRNLFLFALFLLLSVLIRPDYIIFSMLLFTIILAGQWKHKIPLYISLLYIGLLILCYYLPEKLLGNKGWNSLFYHALINGSADPSVKQTIPLHIYLNIVWQKIANINGLIGFSFLLAASLMVLNLKYFKLQKTYDYRLFYIAVIIWVMIKFFLFPVLGLRFIIPPFLLILLCLIKTYQFRFNRFKQNVAYQTTN